MSNKRRGVRFTSASRERLEKEKGKEKVRELAFALIVELLDSFGDNSTGILWESLARLDNCNRNTTGECDIEKKKDPFIMIAKCLAAQAICVPTPSF